MAPESGDTSRVHEPETDQHSSTNGDRATVLIVDDESDLVELYRSWLEDDHAVRTASNGEEALDELTGSVDVVLLDRRMPNLAGDAVLDEIRERELDCRVAMVTAVEPDLDVVEMGFDDYLTKPVSEEEVHATVDRLLSLATYDDRLREYYALASKKATLDAQHGGAELDDSDEYAALEARLADLEEQLDVTRPDLTRDEDDPHRFLTALLCDSGEDGDPTSDVAGE